MAVRDVLVEFTEKWKALAGITSRIRRKKRERDIETLAKSDLFGKIMLLEKCEESKITPEGLNLKLWWEKFRYCKTVSIQNPISDINNPVGFIPLNYTMMLEYRNGKRLPKN